MTASTAWFRRFLLIRPSDGLGRVRWSAEGGSRSLAALLNGAENHV
jgi:hypothetical protein